MADNSAIEWTNSTWNPVTGCTKISAGCDHCYAERFSERFRGVAGHPFETGFDIRLRPERIEQPKRWRRPRLIFVNSMSDLFHKNIPMDYVNRVFDTMETADWHVYQVLTKRSSRMRNFVNQRYSDRSAPSHIWLGVSIENTSAMSRLQHLRQTNAFHSLRVLRTSPWSARCGRPQQHSLGYRWWRERTGCPTRRHPLAPGNTRLLPEPTGRLLLQAVGRPHAQGRRQHARWPAMVGISGCRG